MRRDGKTLVILTPGFPSGEADSACLPAQQAFIRGLNRDFPSITIIILSFQYPFSRSVYRWNHNPVISFGIRKGKFHRLLLWYRVWKTLNRLRNQRRLTGLLSFWCTDCALLGKYFGKLYGIRHYCWILGQDARKENKMVRLIRPHPEELIAMSDALAAEFSRNHHIRPAHVIPNGVDVSLFSERHAARDIDVMGAGSLILLKRYTLFIDCIKELSARFPGLRAVIYGKGPEEEKLRRRIARLRLPNVSLTGERPHAEVLEQMQRARIFLHPSSYEGFSSACLEALYAGAHVISFCRPMQEEISHWHIVSSREELVKKAAELLRDPQLEHTRVVPYRMEDSAVSIMRLLSST